MKKGEDTRQHSWEATMKRTDCTQGMGCILDHKEPHTHWEFRFCYFQTSMKDHFKYTAELCHEVWTQLLPVIAQPMTEAGPGLIPCSLYPSLPTCKRRREGKAPRLREHPVEPLRGTSFCFRSQCEQRTLSRSLLSYYTMFTLLILKGISLVSSSLNDFSQFPLKQMTFTRTSRVFEFIVPGDSSSLILSKRRNF